MIEISTNEVAAAEQQSNATKLDVFAMQNSLIDIGYIEGKC